VGCGTIEAGVEERSICDGANALITDIAVYLVIDFEVAVQRLYVQRWRSWGRKRCHTGKGCGDDGGV